MEEDRSYAVGHISLGYIISKLTAKTLKTEINIPLIFTLSVIPDVDILIPFIEHRGPIHSIVATFIVFIPIFAVYEKKAIPYLLAIVQHSLVGDFFAGGKIQLLWPITTHQYGIEVGIKSLQNIAAEVLAFAALVVIFAMSKDYLKFFRKSLSNLILAIPAFAVIFPMFIRFPINVPLLLMPPHIFYSIFFLIAITNGFRK